MAESYVQVATDGSGKKVRNLSTTEAQAVDASGNAQADLVRYQQVVSAADRRGDLIDVSSEDILTELRGIRAALDLILLALS